MRELLINTLVFLAMYWFILLSTCATIIVINEVKKEIKKGVKGK